MQKVPFLLVLGDQEAADGKVSVRVRGGEKSMQMMTEKFIEIIRMKILNKEISVWD
jgi:threonyl-tRNA synthetase